MERNFFDIWFADMGEWLRALIISAFPDWIGDLVRGADPVTLGFMAFVAILAAIGTLVNFLGLVGRGGSFVDEVRKEGPMEALAGAMSPGASKRDLGKAEAASADRDQHTHSELAEIKGRLAAMEAQFAAARERAGGQQGVVDAEGDARATEALREIVADATPAARAAEAKIASGDVEGGIAILKRDAKAEVAAAAEKWRRIGALTLGINFAESWEAYEEAFRLDPSDFWTCIELARLRQQGGKSAEAQIAATAAAMVARTDRQKMIAASQQGDSHRFAGNWTSAERSYEDALAIAERLVEQNPRSEAAHRDLSLSFERMGDAALSAGKSVEGIAWRERKLLLDKALVKINPDSIEDLRNLSIGYMKLGDAQSDAGDFPAALENFKEDVAISERIARNRPSSSRANRDLSVSYNKLGDTLRAVGELDAAAENFHKALAIRERLASENPKSTEMQWDLLSVRARLGDIAEENRDYRLALRFYEQGLPIAKALVEGDVSNSRHQRALEHIVNRLAELRTKAGR
jgi:tetratricopeptide (TPR) repeat protein